MTLFKATGPGQPLGLATAVRRRTKAALVADALRHEIVVGIRPPGSELPPETQLMQRFGISRPSHREALRVLESEGLIQIARGARGGAKVLMPSLDGVTRSVGVYLQMRGAPLSEFFAARQTYEPAAVALIAARKDPLALSQLAQCVAAQEYSLHDRLAFNTHEAAFRRLLLEHGGNSVLRLMGSMLEEVFQQHMRNVSRRVAPFDAETVHLASGVAAKHNLIRQMAAGDAEAAKHTWEVYIRVYWDRVAQRMGGDPLIEVFASDNPPPVPPITANDDLSGHESAGATLPALD